MAKLLRTLRFMPSVGRSLLACALLSLILAGCTPTARTGNGPGGPGGTSSASPAVVPVTAAPALADTRVTVNPVTYAPGHPCASVSTTTPLAAAPPACEADWLTLESSATSVPGQDFLPGFGEAKTMGLAKGVDVTQGTEVGLAYYRFQAFSTWAEQNNSAAAMQLLDAPGPLDPVADAVVNHGQAVLAVPPCYLPASVRVVSLDADATTFFRNAVGGDVHPLAVLATFARCPGVTVTKGAATTTVDSFNAYSVIAAGFLADRDPFGHVWAPQAYAVCGTPQLAAICGGGP